MTGIVAMIYGTSPLVQECSFLNLVSRFSLLPRERRKRENPRNEVVALISFIIVYFFTMFLFTTCRFWFVDNRNCEETKNDEKHGTLQNEKRIK